MEACAIDNALDHEELKGVYQRLANRYDLQHALLTARADQRGRKILVRHTVGQDDHVLDCGAGTGSTALLAASKTGPGGKVTLFDLSEDMLAVAHEKVTAAGFSEQTYFQSGDMACLPFADGQFDVVLSTYSLCPLIDPQKGALELYRVTRAGGKIGIGHSADPKNPLAKWLANGIENITWRLPWLTMGCRSVSVLPALEQAGGRLVLARFIGVPLWPFFVFVLEKPRVEPNV